MSGRSAPVPPPRLVKSLLSDAFAPQGTAMPLEPSRFRTAAQYYLRGRPPYAAGLIRRVVQLCGLDATHRVLDLGCGPGQLALAFAPFVGQVVGIDPEPEMLRIA